MKYTEEQLDSRLHFFAELLSYEASCYIWTYAPDGALMSTNCPHLALDRVFRHSSGYAFMMEHIKTSSAPLMISTRFGLVWGAVFEMDQDKLERIHVLGPACTQELNYYELEQAIWGKVTPRWKTKFLKIMETVPVISSMMFLHRILMMQYCITGERIHISDIVMQREANKRQQENGEPGIPIDRIQVHMSEQSLLTMIRTGDMNYDNVMAKAARFLVGKNLLSEDPLQNAKLGQVQFIALCCQAAVEGGLAAESAYTRKDAYVQDVEHAKSITEITQIGRTMYEDYIRLVYQQRVNQNFSKAVRSTCDYIENNLREKLTAGLLAGRVGYADYYLSRLFKKETGFSIDEYVRNARIERAKLLLTSSRDSIQEIAEALGFNDRNYFSVTFKKITGIPPAAYRKKYRRL